MRKLNKSSSKNIEVISSDVARIIHAYLLSENKIQQEVCINKILEQLKINDVLNNSLTTQEEKVQVLLESNERKIKELISVYPVYDMFFWMTRVAPHNIYNCSKDMIFAYRNLMYLAIEKYCNLSRTLVHSGNFVNPDYLKVFDREFVINLSEGAVTPTVSQENALIYITEILNACYALETLSYTYVYLTQTYRTVVKGGVFHYNQNKGLYFEFDEKLNYLLSSYDKRLEKINLLSYAGSYFGLNDDYNGNSGKSILLYQTNVENIKLF